MSDRRQPSPDTIQRGYETRDVNNGAVLALAVGIVVLLIVSVLLVNAWTAGMHRRAIRRDLPISPLARERVIPPEPRLQSTPRLDLAEYLAQQQEHLESYGWVDKEQGVLHIPVTRAMDLLLERGLPAPTGLPAESAPETASPGPEPAAPGTQAAPTAEAENTPPVAPLMEQGVATEAGENR